MAIVLGTRWGRTPDDYSLDCPKAFLTYFADRPHLLEIHVSNEAGRRKAGALGIGDFAPRLSVKEINRRLALGDIALLDEYRLRIDGLVSELAPYATIYSQLVLSLGLEDNYRTEAYRALKAVAEEAWPYLIVRNPCTGSKEVAPGHLKETHSTGTRFKTGMCVANEDGNYGQGTSGSRAFLRRYKGCYATFLWRGRHQGRTSPVWTPRNKRKIEIPKSDVSKLSKLMAY